MILDPSGQTVLVSDFVAGAIDRVSLSNGSITTLFRGASPDGLTYDNHGNLFAVLNRNEVAQINPTTGAVIKVTSTFDGNLDGLTFDPTTGKLWVASENGAIWEVSTDLSTKTQFAGPQGTSFDGIEPDGQGHIFLANAFTSNSPAVYEYDIATGTFTKETSVPGLDDLAPVVGSGSSAGPTVVPEPATLLLFGTGLAALATRLRKKLS